MANYRITYKDDAALDRHIDLLPGDDGVRVEWRTDLNRNVTSTGLYETIVQHTLRYVTFDCYFQESAFHQLETFLSFAQQGKPFAFTKDPTKGIELMAFATGIGEEDIFVSDGDVDAFDSGDYIVMMHPNWIHWDVMRVNSTSFDEFNATPPTTHAYPADTPIFWYYYFPQLLLLDDKFDPDRDGKFWHHTFNCAEVRYGT